MINIFWDISTMNTPFLLTLIATGGTIAKTYANNGISNQQMMIDQIIAPLRTPDLSIRYVDLMKIDSLDMTDMHRAQIAKEALHASDMGHAVIITHGTDTMVETGTYLHNLYNGKGADKKKHNLPAPIVLTGAMLPYSMIGSDATQNITEALLSVRLLPSAVYIAFHNRVLPLPHVRKNHQRGTFEATRKHE